MTDRGDLPSLNALRAFEAAARHLNFSRAAEELNVTPSAVSHQMRHLERWLGGELFCRGTRPLSLTEAGLAYFHEVSDSFDRLSAATRLFEHKPQASVIRVETMGSFASEWLVPRLAEFKLLHPELNVRVSTNNEYVDLKADAIDVAIRYGKGDWSGSDMALLFEDHVTPVCSPALLSGDLPLLKPEDLLHHTLIHTAAEVGWEDWLDAAGLSENVDWSRGLFFTKSYLAIRAAINGNGVALVSEPLVEDALARGALVKPFDFTLRGAGSYYVLTPLDISKEASDQDGKIKNADEQKEISPSDATVTFRNWLLSHRKPVPEATLALSECG